LDHPEIMKSAREAIAKRRRARKQAKRRGAEEDCEKMWSDQLIQLEQLAEEAKKVCSQGVNSNEGQKDINNGLHQTEVDQQTEPKADADHDLSTVGNSQDFEIGAMVEVRNNGDQMWKHGVVASIDPLAVIIGDDMMAFEYEHVRTAAFDVGTEVEARSGQDRPWEPGTVATANPLSVFIGDSALAFEYRYVRPKVIKDAVPFRRWWHVAVVLAAIVHMILGWTMARPFLDLDIDGGSCSLLEKTWLGRAMNETAHDAPQQATTTVRRMRELGHLRLSMSDCGGAVGWFTKALAQMVIEGGGQDGESDSLTSPNLSQIESAEYAALLGDRGFALVCARRFQKGADDLNYVVHGSDRWAVPPHQVNALGYALFHIGNYTRAQTVFNELVLVHHGNPLLWNNFAAASMMAGDTYQAGTAIRQAMLITNSMSPPGKDYYLQDLSNNYHILHEHPSARGLLPLVELFNCMPLDLSTLAATKDPSEFQDTFVEVAAIGEEERFDPPQLMQARASVLALEPDPRFCP